MKTATKTATLRWLGLALASVLFAGPAFAETAPAAPIAGETSGAPVQQAAPGSDAARYAAREEQAKGLEQFAGGHDNAIYIGSGALTLILIVLLIVILL